MMERPEVRWLVGVLIILPTASAAADIRLPALIADNMVLQQGHPARIWGWGDAGENVTVRASWQESTVTTQAGQDGAWSVEIAAPHTSGPHTITIEGKNAITLGNVMAGEVWVCSGQSNMNMGLRSNGHWHKGVINAEKEIAAANHPGIRLFTVDGTIATEPQTDCRGKWQVCSPESVADFSAAAYFFGRELNEELDVPIGLIHASWGGTRAETWTSREALALLGDYASELAEAWLAPTEENAIQFRNAENHREARRFLLDANNVGFGKGYADLNFDASGWREMQVPGCWESLGNDMAIDGVVWFRKKVAVPASWANKNLELNLGPVADCDTTYFNGVKLGSLGYGTDRYWEKPRSYRVPSILVRPGEDNLITVRVFDDGGAGGLTGESHQFTIRTIGENTSESLSVAGSWRLRVEEILASNPIRLAHANCPAVLFNGMISPLTPFRIQGVIWYQGGANYARGHAYRRLFPGLIADWRRAWGQGDFPFYYVQTAPFQYDEPYKAAELREAQLMALNVPATGMVVTTDIGDPYDIHPQDKQEIGRRLALQALAQTYGRSGLVYSGPVYRSAKIEDGAIRVQFEHTGSGLVARGDRLTHFSIAGEDRSFVQARASVDGDAVVVESPDVAKPVAVRFGWQNAPTPNLFSVEGLPASPFRTDDWEDACNAALPLSGVFMSASGDASNLDATVQIHADEVLVEDFLGVGVQWSAYPWWDVSDEDWEKVFRRVEFMRLPLVRVMLDAFWYCQGFDSQGEPIYAWDTPFMKKLYRLLDWCERNDVLVVIGEWSRPNGADLELDADDPRWARIVADFVQHMLDRKGYTCLKYYNLINEPHGWWSHVSWDQWSTAITNLHREFQQRGLLGRIGIASPDADSYFTTKSIKNETVRTVTDIYDEHWYVTSQDVERGLLELWGREQLRQVRRRDPGKPFILGEFGLVDDKTPTDQQLHVFDYWYGVAMADAAIQFIRGGLSGFIAWDLDDSMHFFCDGDELMNSLSDVLPDNAYERRKIWGFWSILGGEHGQPDDEHMRPWYYPWAIMSRAFPPGCQTLATEETGVPQLRVAAARIPAGDSYHLSCAVVNNSEWGRTVRVHAPRCKGTADFGVYLFADENRDNVVDSWPHVVDRSGRDVFPRVTGTVSVESLSGGGILRMPAKSVAILTTLEHGKPVKIAADGG